MVCGAAAGLCLDIIKNNTLLPYLSVLYFRQNNVKTSILVQKWLNLKLHAPMTSNLVALATDSHETLPGINMRGLINLVLAC